MKLSNVTKPKPLKQSNVYSTYTNDQLRIAFDAVVAENKQPSKIQQEICYRQNLVLREKDDLSALPEETIKELKKKIKEGAKDTTQMWANALELVHKAYDVLGIQRPDITMEAAWKQYEELIETAVKELAKARGLDGRWRSTSITTESEDTRVKFAIESELDGLPVRVERKAEDIEEIIQPFFDHNVTGCDIEIKHRSKNHVILYFCNDKGRTGAKVTIRRA